MNDREPIRNGKHEEGFRFIERAISNEYAKIQKEFSIQKVETPLSLVDEMLERIGDLEGKDVLIIANYDVAKYIAWLRVFFFAKRNSQRFNYKSLTLLTDVEVDGNHFDVVVDNLNEVDKIDTMGKKFDVVIGNPPYQKTTESDTGNRQGGLWYDFLQLAMGLDADVISFVTPTSLFSTGGFGSKSHKVSSILNNGYGFTSIKDSTDDFNVGIKISSYNIVKGYAGDTEISEGYIKLNTNHPVPFNMNVVSNSIVSKTYNHGGGWPFTEVFKGDNEEDFQVRTNGGRFKKWDKTTVGKGNFGNKGQGIVINEDEVQGYESLFKSKLFKYIFTVLGGESGQSATGILKALPNPGTDKVWTSTELYEYFKLTSEEITAVESV